MTSGKPHNPLLPVLRVAVLLQLVAVLLQAAFAGEMLAGVGWGYPAHQTGAGVVHIAGTVQLIIAILYWRPGRGPVWPALVSLAILIGGFVQSAMGAPATLTVHVPLGVSLAVLTTWLAVWVLMPRRGYGAESNQRHGSTRATTGQPAGS